MINFFYIFFLQKKPSEDLPSTPTQQKPSADQTSKTPVNKTNTLSNLLQSGQKSALKKHSFYGAGADAPSTNSLLATSSFNRRKSYDLNRSLTKPLNYKPHVGKIMPLFDATQKSSLFQTRLNGAANLNETKVIDKSCQTTAVLKASTNNLETDALKKRLSIFKGSRDRTEITNQLKEQNLIKKNIDSTLKEKKIRTLKTKKHKHEKDDKRRNVELADADENAAPVA